MLLFRTRLFVQFEIDVAERAKRRARRLSRQHGADPASAAAAVRDRRKHSAALRVSGSIIPIKALAKPVLIFGEQQPVAHVGDSPWIVRIKRRNANRLAHQYHQACRVDPFAGDVADCHHDFAGRIFEGVVPVAPDVGLGRAGPIVRGEFDTLAPGKAPRQKRALQGFGDVLFAMKLLGVSDGQAGAPAQLDRKGEIAFVEFAVFTRPHEGECTEDMILRDDRSDDLRPVAEPPHVVLVLARCRVRHERCLVDVRQEEGLAAARDLDDRMHAEFFDVQQRRDAAERLFPARIAMRSGGDEEPVGPFIQKIEDANIGKRLNGKARDVV